MDLFKEYILTPFIKSVESSGEELTPSNTLDLFRKFINLSSQEITPEPKVVKTKRLIKTKNRYFKTREEYDEACRNGEKLCSHLYTKKNSLHQNTICGAPAQNADDTDDPDLWKCSSCKKRHGSVKESKSLKEIVSVSVVKPGFNISIPKNNITKDKVKSEHRNNLDPNHRYCLNRGLVGYILDYSDDKIVCIGKIDDTEEEIPETYIDNLSKLSIAEIASIKNYNMEYNYRPPTIKPINLSSDEEDIDDFDSDEDEDKILNSVSNEKVKDITVSY